MDGVLVDFIRPSLKIHNREDIRYTDVDWDIDLRIYPENREKFWTPLGYDFWANLPWHPNGQWLFGEIERMVGLENICLCTSPCKTEGGLQGKLDWIIKNLPKKLHRQYSLQPKKFFSAGPYNILLDDNEENVELFEKRGGKTVLIPEPWNRRAGECFLGNYDTIQIREELLALWRS